MDLIGIIDEAYRRLGRDPQTLKGGDLESARISIELILQQWSMWGLVSWASEPISLTVTSETATLPTGTIDVLPFLHWRSGDSDIPLQFLQQFDWMNRTTPQDTGTPSHYTVDKRAQTMVVRFWPAPTVDLPSTIIGWRLRSLNPQSDLTIPGDFPTRWAAPMIAELANDLYGKQPAEMRNQAILADVSMYLLAQRKAIFADNSEMGSWYF